MQGLVAQCSIAFEIGGSPIKLGFTITLGVSEIKHLTYNLGRALPHHSNIDWTGARSPYLQSDLVTSVVDAAVNAVTSLVPGIGNLFSKKSMHYLMR